MRQFQQLLNRALASHFTSPLMSASFCAGLFYVKVPVMEKSLLKKQVRLLQILAQGCKRRPAYSAIRPATGRCAPCVRMWGARLELRKLQS